MKERFEKLLEVKSILSLGLVATTCYLSIVGKIQMETFMALTTSVITYYFARKEQ